MIDLKPFCVTESDLRDYLRSPFRFAGHSYATDGHTAIRLVDDGPDTANEKQRDRIAKPVDLWLSEAKGPDAEYFDLPVPADPWDLECPDCHGKTAEKPKVCPDCSNNGYVTVSYHSIAGASYDVEADCPVCEEANNGVCNRCDGRGRLERLVWCQIGDVAYANKELSRLQGIPGVRVRPRGTEAAHLVFDGGEGLLMPLRGLGGGSYFSDLNQGLRDSSQRTP